MSSPKFFEPVIIFYRKLEILLLFYKKLSSTLQLVVCNARPKIKIGYTVGHKDFLCKFAVHY